MSTILNLIFEFMVTGLFAFGGGLATLPFLYEMGARTGWFGDNDILKMIALSEATPGPLGVNMATYVGFITLGWFGGIVASFALVLPSVVVIILISLILQKFKNSQSVQAVFRMLRPASTGLIAAAGCAVAKVTFLNELPTPLSSLTQFSEMFNYKAIAFGVILFFIMKRFDKVHPIFYIIASAGIGILFNM